MSVCPSVRVSTNCKIIFKSIKPLVYHQIVYRIDNRIDYRIDYRIAYRINYRIDYRINNRIDYRIDRQWMKDKKLRSLINKLQLYV